MSTAMSDPRRVRRATVKQDRIVRALRQQIVSGQLKPHSQLPNQAELVRRFQVSSVTIQKSLERLARDGFVVSHPRQGVYVGAHPPHLVDYCLIFPHDTAKMAHINRFLFSLSQIAAGLSAESQRRTSIYVGIESPTDTPPYRQLVNQVERQCAAGIIFLSRPQAFVGTPLLADDGIPRVAIMAEPTIPGVVAVQIDGFIGEAMDWLKEQGRRRISMICTPQMPEEEVHSWMQSAQVRGMALPRHCVLAAPMDAPHWAQHAVRALMELPPAQRPDGLVIANDNLVPQATAGLLSGGINVPRDCSVVAHGNFPWATDSLVPARRFGPDTRRVLAACLEVIDATRRGQDVPERIVVPVTSDVLFAAQDAADTPFRFHSSVSAGHTGNGGSGGSGGSGASGVSGVSGSSGGTRR
ncbi:MAG: GntR family transcriptional regulator [Phycisphaeraceae bacterium]